MKKLFAAAVIGMIALGGVAQARETLQVRLATPLAKSQKIIADSTVFNCEGEMCAAVIRSSLSVRTCRELAEELGPVAKFATAKESFGEEELARCNARAKQVEATQQAAN